VHLLVTGTLSVDLGRAALRPAASPHIGGVAVVRYSQAACRKRSSFASEVSKPQSYAAVSKSYRYLGTTGAPLYSDPLPHRAPRDKSAWHGVCPKRRLSTVPAGESVELLHAMRKSRLGRTRRFDEAYYAAWYGDIATRGEMAARAVRFVLSYIDYMEARISSALDLGCGLGLW
jgi:hypothetical protein